MPRNGGKLGVGTQRPDVIQNMCARFESRLRHSGFIGINGNNRIGKFVVNRLNDRDDACISSSALTVCEPGRVDSPPTSRISRLMFEEMFRLPQRLLDQIAVGHETRRPRKNPA